MDGWRDDGHERTVGFDDDLLLGAVFDERECLGVDVWMEINLYDVSVSVRRDGLGEGVVRCTWLTAGTTFADLRRVLRSEGS